MVRGNRKGSPSEAGVGRIGGAARHAELVFRASRGRL